jgi:toxin ParE1/3/4
MAYQVSTSPRAERDFANLYKVINAEESDTALNWYRALKEAILSLEELPYRCPVTPEKGQFRHLLYGRKPDVYRVIYRIMETHKRVEIVHIRHGASRPFTPSDLK